MYDVEIPQTFKTVCLKCHSCLHCFTAEPLLFFHAPSDMAYIYFACDSPYCNEKLRNLFPLRYVQLASNNNFFENNNGEILVNTIQQ